MAFSLNETVEISAPLDRVWQVVVDLDRYGEWNPFCVAARSSLEVGSPIHMRVRLVPFFTQSQTETVLEHTPRERLAYGVVGSFLGAIKSHRYHIVEAVGAECTRYTSDFELGGWLAPLVVGLFGRRLRAGFAANTACLKARAEGHPADGADTSREE